MTLQVLTQTYRALNKALEAEASNVARADTDSPRQQVEMNIVSQSGHFMGLRFDGTSSTLNEHLSKMIREQNSQVSELEKIADLYERTERTVLKDPRRDDSFFHSCMAMFQKLGLTNVGRISLSDVCNAMQKWQQDMRQVGNMIQSERARADSGVSQSIEYVNGLLNDIAKLNTRIVQSQGEQRTLCMDERSQKLHVLSGYMGVRTLTRPDGMIDVLTGTQMQVVTGSHAGKFIYRSSGDGSAGTTYSPITFTITGNRDHATDAMHALRDNNGALSAFITIRDKTLVGLQEQFDVIAQQTIDAMNARHNQGTSKDAPATMQGERLPNGAALESATALRGSGTVRIGLLDNDQHITQFMDVDLRTIRTAQDIVGRVNASVFGLQATIRDGVLSLQSTSGRGIVIGRAHNAPEPTLHFVDGTYARGFSHFFGLNNVFCGGTGPLAGRCRNMSVRPDIISSRGQSLSRTYARHSGGVWEVQDDYTLLREMQGVMDEARSFPTTQEQNGSNVSIRQYMLSLFERYTQHAHRSRESLEHDTEVLSQMSSDMYSESGVDMETENERVRILLMKLQLVMKTMALIQNAEDKILDKL